MGGESIGIVPNSVDERYLEIGKLEPKDSRMVDKCAQPSYTNAAKCLKLLNDMIPSNQMSSPLQ